MKSIIVLSFVILSTLLFSALTSCSDDNPAAPATIVPSVGITTSQQSPQTGDTIYFAAHVSGITYNAPRYSWNFGDGTSLDNSLSSTITHTYLAKGTYRVTVLVTDGTSPVRLRDSLTIEVNEKPEPFDSTLRIWSKWKKIELSVHAGFVRRFWRQGYQTELDTTTVKLVFGPYPGIRWTDYRMEFDSTYDSGRFSSKISLHVYLADSARQLDSLHMDESFSYSGMGSQSSSQNAQIGRLYLTSNLCSDSAIYRADGLQAYDIIKNVGKHEFRSNSVDYSIDFDHPTPDMWVEVKFYKK